MRFDVTDLRVFLHACAEGSMTAAAQRAHLTLAAVSARIRAMEEDLGVVLLERKARGVAPTPAGRVIAVHAQGVLQRLDVLGRELSAAGNERMVVLANSSGIARPLGTVIAAVLRDHPSLRIELRESPSEATVSAVRAGFANLGIISDAADVDGLHVDQLGTDSLVVVMAASHPLSSLATIRFHLLLQHEVVSWGAGDALRMHLRLHALRAGEVLRERAVVHGAADAISITATGTGVTVLPSWIADTAGAGSAYVVRPLDEPWAHRHLLLCRRLDTENINIEFAGRLKSSWPC